MAEWTDIGKVLIVAGSILLGLGLFFFWSDRVSGLGSVFGWVGKLPGDISIKRDNVSFYFPLATSVLLSLLLSLVFYLLSWLFRR